MKNYVFFLKLLLIIHDSTGHGVHNITSYNIVSQNLQILVRFPDITHFVGIYE